MSTKFYPVKVKEITKTTADCSVVTLAIEEDLQTLFGFQQGQHLTLRKTINGEDLRRTYSLCTSPLEKEWKIAVKQVPQGKFSTFVNEILQVGDTLEVMPPNGRFFVEVQADLKRHFVVFAAGSGITPILSIIKTHLEQESQSSFQLFYLNRTVASIILREEIEALKNNYLDRLEVFYFLTQEKRNVPLFNGRFDKHKLEELFKVFIDIERVDDYFICGPGAMIFNIRDYLIEQGVQTKQIHFELFNTKGAVPKGKIKTTSVSPGSVAVNLLEGEKSFTFKMENASETILDAALKHGADLPFACKGGVCCTCKAKLLKGEVEMKVNYALEQEQLEAGYILSCQAVPLSSEIVVDFDG